MKKFLMLSLMLLLMLPQLHAADSIYDYIKKMDDKYVVAVGLKGASEDSLAAMDIILGLKRETFLDLEPTIESLISPEISKILIGHPCGNSLIKLSCEGWPYDEGYGIIKVIDNDLVVAGTTPSDTRRAAKVIADFMAYPQLRQSKFVLVKGDILDINDIDIVMPKREQDFVCGDNVCDPGEKFLCSSDCQQITCFTLCRDKGFDSESCRNQPANLNLPFCKKDEESQGLGYCSTGKVCCCKNNEAEQEEQVHEEVDEPEIVQEEGFFKKILSWLKELFSVLF